MVLKKLYGDFCDFARAQKFGSCPTVNKLHFNQKTSRFVLFVVTTVRNRHKSVVWAKCKFFFVCLLERVGQIYSRHFVVN